MFNLLISLHLAIYSLALYASFSKNLCTQLANDINIEIWPQFTLAGLLTNSEIQQHEVISLISEGDISAIGSKVHIKHRQKGSGSKVDMFLILGRFIEPTQDVVVVINSRTLKFSSFETSFLLDKVNTEDARYIRKLPSFPGTVGGQLSCKNCVAQSLRNFSIAAQLQAMVRTGKGEQPDRSNLIDLLYGEENAKIVKKFTSIIYEGSDESPKVDISGYLALAGDIARPFGYDVHDSSFDVILDHLKYGPAIINYYIMGEKIGHSVFAVGIANTESEEFLISLDSQGFGGMKLIPLDALSTRDSWGIVFKKQRDN